MLHTINKSPYEKNSFETCMRLAAAESSILLIEDGVYAAIDNTKISELIKENPSNFKFYVLEADLKARGLDKNSLIPNIEIISYKGFVKLTVENEKTQTWL
ncbi:MAG: sulfurtransferase complex subunit TusB [Gammaproteobacteria bacterium]|nr:sulfurtransferase complex subunit TusB [Gammaproteobacteria bacterium]|tara:strand:- start:2953 stop:3255 length:303 start_codon:yes stop_codon:yes gene_type:complete